MPTMVAALRRSLLDGGKVDQGMLRYVLDQSQDCIKILNPEARIEYVNSEGQCALDIADFSKICGRYWPDLWPASSRAIVETAVEKARAGEGSTFEAWRPSPSGDKSWWQISVSPLKETSDELAGILTISRESTEHVRLRESERTLALEMKHRLRNAYTVASAIVTQSARGDEDTKRFAETVTGRLADVALSQARLLEAGEKSWTVAELIQTLVAAHGEGAEGVRFTGAADVEIDGHQAMLVALVIGELTNNSLKYGALGNGRPVALSWSATSGKVAMKWREPLVAELAAPLGARDAGSGYSLMKRMAKSQRATLEFEAAGKELRVDLGLNQGS